MNELTEKQKEKYYKALIKKQKKLVSNKQEEITLLETITDPVIIYKK